jgi:predicted Zn-dependent protease
MTRMLVAAAAAAVLALPVAAEAQIWNTLGRAAGGALGASFPIGLEKEVEIGRGIAATVAGRWKVLDDPALMTYVGLVGSVVAQQSPRANEVAWKFAVLDTDEVNAFAAPGGYVFITRGALEVIESEAELAGVLAHEVGHVDAKHVLAQVRKFDMMSRARAEADLDGPLLDLIAGRATSMLFMGLNRQDEQEADSLAVAYAAAAGYQPDGMLQFLRHVKAVEQADAPDAQQRPRLRRPRNTHPDTDARLANMERQVAALGWAPDAGQLLADRYRTAVTARLRARTPSR